MTRGGIQRHYVDALGTHHVASAETLRAIARATGAPPAGRAGVDRSVIVVHERTRVRTGPAEVRLEDGSTIAVDRTLPPDLPLGYHAIAPRRGPTARLIVAPAACYLPADYRTWGW